MLLFLAEKGQLSGQTELPVLDLLPLNCYFSDHFNVLSWFSRASLRGKRCQFHAVKCRMTF